MENESLICDSDRLSAESFLWTGTALQWQRPQVGNLFPSTCVCSLCINPHRQNGNASAGPPGTHTPPSNSTGSEVLCGSSQSSMHVFIKMPCTALPWIRTDSSLNKVWLWGSRRGTLSGVFQNVHILRDWWRRRTLSIESFDFPTHFNSLSVMGTLRAPDVIRGARIGRELRPGLNGVHSLRAKPTWLKWHECRSTCSYPSLCQGWGSRRWAVLSSWAVSMTLEHWI